jgi:uncharacterized membrane-anchored protein
MMDLLAKPAMRIALAAALLTTMLGWMVVDRLSLLRSGREIVLKVIPVDPRDLFKGDYVRLGYDISRVDKAMVEGPEVRPGERVFVTLQQTASDAPWSIAKVARTRPATVAANQIVLAAKGTYNQLSYGLERYYLPEGTGIAMEDNARKGVMSAIVAVNAKGQSAIKGLIIDGKKVYEEPLL